MNQQKLLERLNHNKNNDNDQQQGRNFIENAEKPGIPHPLVTGKPPEITLKHSMVQKQQENRRQFPKTQICKSSNCPTIKSRIPDNRLINSAGRIIATIKRRSIVLKSSLASLPGDTSQW